MLEVFDEDVLIALDMVEGAMEKFEMKKDLPESANEKVDSLLEFIESLLERDCETLSCKLLSTLTFCFEIDSPFMDPLPSTLDRASTALCGELVLPASTDC